MNTEKQKDQYGWGSKACQVYNETLARTGSSQAAYMAARDIAQQEDVRQFAISKAIQHAFELNLETTIGTGNEQRSLTDRDFTLEGAAKLAAEKLKAEGRLTD